MPRGNKLNEKEQGIIIALRGEGLTMDAIAQRLGRSKNAIHQFLKVFLYYSIICLKLSIFRIQMFMVNEKGLAVQKNSVKERNDEFWLM